MLIKKLALENIRSYENAVIEFPNGSVVLAGDIGSGKTSVLLAIEFALFGLQPGQRGASLLRNDKNEGKVILEIDIDEKKIIIERRLKRGKTVNQDDASIIIDNYKEELSVTELKNKILFLLNYPKEFEKKTNLLYRFTVYTPQEEMKQIILETPETRLDTLRHIFGIDKYKRIKENASILAIRLREMTRNLEGQIKNLDELRKKLLDRQESIKIVEEKIIILKKEVEERKKLTSLKEQAIKEVEEKIKEKEKYELAIDKTKLMLFNKKENFSELENETKLILKQIEEAKKVSFSEENLLNLEKELMRKEKETQENEKAYLDIAGKINSNTMKLIEAEKMKDNIKKLVNCPTCFQNVPDDYKSHVLRKFDDDILTAKKEISLLAEEKTKKQKEIENAKILAREIKNKIAELKILKLKLENIKEKETKKQELETRKNAIIKDMEMLELQLANLKEASSLLKKYEIIFLEREKELNESRKKEKEKEIELASMEKEKSMTIIFIKEQINEIEQKEKLKIKLIAMAELEDWLSSSFLALVDFTEKNIMLKLREEFSKLFNEWFNILVPEIFSVHLDEDFTPIIEQKDYQMDYSHLSGGERTAIALAYRLALNQTINSLLSRIKTRDIVILDEPTDGFSEQQLDKMRDVLNQLKVKQLIIVSHESKIESFVENIIKFKKQDGVTRVER